MNRSLVGIMSYSHLSASPEQRNLKSVFNNPNKLEVCLMTHEIDYAAAETKGCSSRITIGNKIFYIKLFESNLPTRYLVADQKGLIIKEISKNEFEFWLRTLADEEDEIEQIGNKLSLGKRYLR